MHIKLHTVIMTTAIMQPHYLEHSRRKETTVIMTTVTMNTRLRTERKEEDYTFRRQFNEEPSNIPGCSKTKNT